MKPDFDKANLDFNPKYDFFVEPEIQRHLVAGRGSLNSKTVRRVSQHGKTRCFAQRDALATLNDALDAPGGSVKARREGHVVVLTELGLCSNPSRSGALNFYRNLTWKCLLLLED